MNERDFIDFIEIEITHFVCLVYFTLDSTSQKKCSFRNNVTTMQCSHCTAISGALSETAQVQNNKKQKRHCISNDHSDYHSANMGQLNRDTNRSSHRSLLDGIMYRSRNLARD
jgi:hypothetical protein